MNFFVAHLLWIRTLKFTREVTFRPAVKYFLMYPRFSVFFDSKDPKSTTLVFYLLYWLYCNLLYSTDFEPLRMLATAQSNEELYRSEFG